MTKARRQMKPSMDPVPEHLRPLAPARPTQGWVWQVPLGVLLTLGALYLVAGLGDPCARGTAICPPLSSVDAVLTPPPSKDTAKQATPARTVPMRPVMTYALAPLPLGLADVPPAQDYSLPTGLTIEDMATQGAAIALDQINLIAVVERDGLRHALVRLPGGRILRLREGDPLQDGTVAAIGANTLYMLGADNRPRALVLGG